LLCPSHIEQIDETPDDRFDRQPTGDCPELPSGIADSAGFLFWDQIHPTAGAHDFLGVFAFGTLDAASRGETMADQKVLNRRALGTLRGYANSGNLPYNIASN
jgi:phospholipase/lecithinase/hemolysin